MHAREKINFKRPPSGKNFFLVNLLTNFFFLGEPSVSIFFSRRPSKSIFFFAIITTPPPQMINGRPLSSPGISHTRVFPLVFHNSYKATNEQLVRIMMTGTSADVVGKRKEFISQFVSPLSKFVIWRGVICLQFYIHLTSYVLTSSTSPHMWLADGDSLLCYIVRM